MWKKPYFPGICLRNWGKSWNTSIKRADLRTKAWTRAIQNTKHGCSLSTGCNCTTTIIRYTLKVVCIYSSVLVRARACWRYCWAMDSNYVSAIPPWTQCQAFGFLYFLNLLWITNADYKSPTGNYFRTCICVWKVFNVLYHWRVEILFSVNFHPACIYNLIYFVSLFTLYFAS